jgi:hypothetical protein
MKETWWIEVLGLVVITLVVACGGAEEEVPGGSDGGSGLMGNAGSGGVAAMSPDAAGGSGGQVTTVAPEPALDCSGQTQTNHCMSAAGFIDGDRFDFSCRGDTGGDRGRASIGGTVSYSMNCEDAQQGYSLHLSLPQPGPGAFTVALPGSDGAQLRIRNTEQSGSSDSENFESGSVTGTLERTAGAQGDIDTITGTFEATWLQGDATCRVGCVPIVIKGTFRTVFDF